jgi:hypothetical protein
MILVAAFVDDKNSHGFVPLRDGLSQHVCQSEKVECLALEDRRRREMRT